MNSLLREDGRTLTKREMKELLDPQSKSVVDEIIFK